MTTLAWPFGRLSMFGYNVVEADPAWDFENYSDKGTKKGADPHYEVMPLADIRALPVGQLARPGFEGWGREATKFDDPHHQHEHRRVLPLPEPMTLFPDAAA